MPLVDGRRHQFADLRERAIEFSGGDAAAMLDRHPVDLVRAGGWQIVPGTPEHDFHEDPGTLWTELEGRGDGANVVASVRPRGDGSIFADNGQK
jgi:hypothetical protein